MSEFKASFSTDEAFRADFGQVYEGQGGIASEEVDRIRVLDLAEYESIEHDDRTLYFIRG